MYIFKDVCHVQSLLRTIHIWTVGYISNKFGYYNSLITLQGQVLGDAIFRYV